MAGKRSLTIDEWFYHKLAREDSYKSVAALLIKVFDVCDKITLQKGSRLAHKFFQLDQESGRWTPDQREIVRVIKNLFLSNSEKITWVEENDLISDDTKEKLPRKDLYLVNICLQTQEKILITTDQTLYDNLLETQASLGITPIMLEDFIERYSKNPDDII